MALNVRNLQVQINTSPPMLANSGRKAGASQLESNFAQLLTESEPRSSRAVESSGQSHAATTELFEDGDTGETELPKIEEKLDPAAFDIDDEFAAALVAQPLPAGNVDSSIAATSAESGEAEPLALILRQDVVQATTDDSDESKPSVVAAALAAEQPVWNLVMSGMRSVGVDQPDPQAVINRISQLAQQLAPEGSSRVQVRLNPPELGVLRVDMTVRHDVVSLRMHAVTAVARDMLTAQVGQLQESLSQQGLTLARFEVTVVRNSSTENQPGDHQSTPDRERKEMHNGRQQQQRQQRQPNHFDLGENG